MQTCTHCHVGNLHRRPITYANWHAGQFVVVPHLPAWQCDVCAEVQIDADAINRLMPVLGPVTQPDPAQPRRVRHAPPAEPRWDEQETDPERKRA